MSCVNMINMPEIIKLRPHHLLCIIAFEPKGYDELYILFMQKLIDWLSNNPKQKILLTDGLCITCDYCPHNDNGKCVKELKVQEIVQNILNLTRLTIGETMEWETLRQIVAKKIIIEDKFYEACGICSFYEQCRGVLYLKNK